MSLKELTQDMSSDITDSGTSTTPHCVNVNTIYYYMSMYILCTNIFYNKTINRKNLYNSYGF